LRTKLADAQLTERRDCLGEQPAQLRGGLWLDVVLGEILVDQLVERQRAQCRCRLATCGLERTIERLTGVAL
jgi:hypothetical protein